MSAATNLPSGPPTTQNENAAAPPKGARLVPMNLEEPAEQDILLEQRKICGWNQEKIPQWKDSMARGERTLFWITIPPSDKTGGMTALKRQDQDDVFAVGHVSLDKFDLPGGTNPPDTTLASGDGSVMTITTLFVLPQFKSLRLGAFTMDECERMSQEEPYGSRHCRAVTVNTLSSRYLPGGGVDGPDGVGRWAWIGQDMPLRDNALWYTRRGYVAYKEEVRYYSSSKDGTEIGWYGVFMRKDLKHPDDVRVMQESSSGNEP